MFTRLGDAGSPPPDQAHGTPHQLLKHIEFPYYNEETPSRDKIVEELDHYIEVLCKAENYMNQEPTKGCQMQDAAEQQQHSDLDITIIDWDSFDISTYDTQQTEQPAPDIYTTASPTHAPIYISISSLWNILRLQHICGSQENMVDILKAADRDYYQILDGDRALVVSKAFDWEEEDGESVKSFSSREDW